MRAPTPCHLTATSFGGRLKSQFRAKHREKGRENEKENILDVWCMDFVSEPMEDHFADKELIYLTADSEHELEQIEEGKVYVIGAFVDRNRLKGYTYDLAKSRKWRTAKLPILKFMKLDDEDEHAQMTRLVITINQVFAALIAFYHWKDWRKALRFALPKRKGLVLRHKLEQKEIEQLVFDGHCVPLQADLE